MAGIKLSPFQRFVDFIATAGIYLESGFLDLLSTGQCTEDAYKPAILNYDDITAAYVTGTSTPLQGNVEIEGIEDEAIIAIHDTEVIVANTIDLDFNVIVTNDDDTVEFSIATDYTATATGITALSSGSITDGQPLHIDYIIDTSKDEAPFTGEALLDGAESLAVGCGSKLQEITDPCSNTYSAGGYCDASIFIKKDVQSKVPSSMFSGKLRLFIQALYGSTRTDYRLKNNFDIEVGDIIPFTFFRGFTNNSWLYTTAEYDYFICTYLGASIQFKELELSDAGQQFADILKQHPRNSDFTFVTRVEAYILATATVSANIHSTITITGDTINGSPLDYGWHAEWDGHTATVVCFYDDPLLPQYLSDQHQLTISEVWNGSVYTFTVANTRLQSDMPWWPRTNGLNLFYYSELDQSMYPVEYPAILLGGFEGTFDSPIYNYYVLDANTGLSELITVDIFMDLAQPANTGIDESSQKRYSNSSHRYVDVQTYGGPSGSKGFKIDGVSIESIVENLSYSRTSDITLKGEYGIDSISGLYFGRSGDTTPMSDSTTPTSKDYLESLGYTIGETREVDEENQYLCFMHYRFEWSLFHSTYDEGKSTTANIFIQTLLGDCSNVVLGRSETIAHGERRTTEWFDIDKAIGGKLYWSLQNPSSFLSPDLLVTISEMPGPNYVHVLPTYHDNVGGLGPFENITTPAEPGATVIELFQYSGGIQQSVVITSSTNLNEYFSPTTSEPATNTTDTGRNSINNKYKIAHDAFTTDEGFINDSSVGWS